MSRLFSLIKGSPEALPPAFSCGEFASPRKSSYIPTPWNFIDETGIWLFLGPMDSLTVAQLSFNSWRCSAAEDSWLLLFLPSLKYQSISGKSVNSPLKSLQASLVSNKMGKMKGSFCLLLDMCKIKVKQRLGPDLSLNLKLHLISKEVPFHHYSITK